MQSITAVFPGMTAWNSFKVVAHSFARDKMSALLNNFALELVEWHRNEISREYDLHWLESLLFRIKLIFIESLAV